MAIPTSESAAGQEIGMEANLIPAPASTPHAKQPGWRLALGTVLGTSMVLALTMASMQPMPPKRASPLGVGNFSIQLSLAEGCGEQYDKCGGKDFTGPSCCKVGCGCVADGEYYSSCKPLGGGDACQKEKAMGHANEKLASIPPLAQKAAESAKAKAAAAKEVATAFAQAAAQMMQAAKAAKAEAEAIKSVATAKPEDFVQQVQVASGAAKEQMVKGKAAWQAGDAAHKKEEKRIHAAIHADDAFQKMKEVYVNMSKYLGGSDA